MQVRGARYPRLLIWVVTASLIAIVDRTGGELRRHCTPLKGGWFLSSLKRPSRLQQSLLCFESANLVEHETGLLAVTVFGMALANAKLASIAEMRRFKEYVTVLFVSGVFVVLTATLTVDVLYAIDWRLIGFVLAMLVFGPPHFDICEHHWIRD